jgi:hypothetical protein
MTMLKSLVLLGFSIHPELLLLCQRRLLAARQFCVVPATEGTYLLILKNPWPDEESCSNEQCFLAKNILNIN